MYLNYVLLIGSVLLSWQSDPSLRSHISVSIELLLNKWNSLLIRLFLFPFALLKVTDIGGHAAGYASMVFRLQNSGHGALGDALAFITISVNMTDDTFRIHPLSWRLGNKEYINVRV